jgi:diguanylate cyclase (GGDEF)-like protein
MLIYFIRAYIQYQQKKNSIHDHDTHLFNQKYFLARLHTAIERAKREKSPLSMFFLSVDNFTDQAYNTKQKKHLSQQTAHILGLVTRESDTVCRYDDNHFAVLMSLTDKNDALNLEERMKCALEAYNFKVTPEPQFTFKTTEFDPSETKGEFIARSEN